MTERATDFPVASEAEHAVFGSRFRRTHHTLDLADLLLAVNEIAVRSAISWLGKQTFAEDRWPSATEKSVKSALGHLGNSYYAFANRRHGDSGSSSESHRRAAWAAFDEDLDDEVFAEWVRASLRDSAVSLSSIREGNSIIVGLSFADIAAMTTMTVDYSLVKETCEIVRIPVESSGSGFHMLSSSGNAGNSFL